MLNVLSGGKIVEDPGKLWIEEPEKCGEKQINLVGEIKFIMNCEIYFCLMLPRQGKS